MTKQTTVHFRDGQKRVIEEVERVTHVREDVPKARQSELIRRLVDLGIEHAQLSELVGGDAPEVEEVPVSELLSESVIAKYRHNRFKELEGWLNNQRSGFRTQVANHFKKRFKNGYSQDELETFTENMRVKAHYLWPGEDYEQEREDALAYVEAVETAAVEAIEKSEVDPLDPETLFESFEGVEDAQTRETVEQTRETQDYERLVAEAESRIQRVNDRGKNPDLDALADALATSESVDREVAVEAIEEAANNVLGGAA